MSGVYKEIFLWTQLPIRLHRHSPSAVITRPRSCDPSPETSAKDTGPFNCNRTHKHLAHFPRKTR